METWNERLTRARLDKKLTKTALAKMVGVSQPTVTDWEGGVMQPNGINLLAVCRVLGISPEWLTTGRDIGAPPKASEPSITYAEYTLLADFALLLEEDQQRIAAEVKKLADVARAYRARFGGKIADNDKVGQALPPAPGNEAKKIR